MKRYILAAVGLVAVASLSYLGASDAQQERPVNPCAGKTDAECEALISEARADFESRYPVWLEELQRKPLDLNGLPRAVSNVDWFSVMPDLPSAVREAEAIAQVQATNVHFVPFEAANVTVSVERVLKGDLPSQLTIVQNNGIAAVSGPSGEWQPVLSLDEAEPLLFPGDRALLFLESVDRLGYIPQPFTGYYRVDAQNRLEALASNPFGQLADGKPLEEFLAAVQAALAAGN